MNRDLHKSSGPSPSGFNNDSRGCSGAEPVVCRHNNSYRPCRGRINNGHFSAGILFNPSGVVDFIFSITTGFGLWPSPAAILMMTLLGSVRGDDE